MSAGGKGVRHVDQMEADIVRQIAELQIKLATVRELKRKMIGEPEPRQVSTRGRRGTNVKSYLLELLDKRGYLGLTATTAVDIATQEGRELERGTVSSLLSRMKADGIIAYDNVVYRLPKHSTAPTGPEKVVQHPSAKASFS